jgi:hypothetical protein
MAGQVWGTDILGGFMYSDELSDVLRMALQPMFRFRQACDAKDASKKGLQSGDLYHWNVYSKVTTKGAKLTEGDAVPETNFTIKQGQLQVDEYVNSVPFTLKLDNLSKQPVTEIINKVLKNDANDVIEDLAYAQFKLTPLVAAPASGNSATDLTFDVDGTPTETNNLAMNTDHFKGIVDEMKERDIPAFNGNSYFAIGRTRTWRPIKNQLEGIHKYIETGFSMIMNGELGRYEATRVLEQTGIDNAGWTNGKSDEAFFYGEDTVAEGIVVPEEIRGKLPTNYGLSKGVAWYALLGFGLVHTDAPQARIIRWDSAA